MLELDHVTRWFGDLVALDGLSFAVEPGQMFGFVRSNGAAQATARPIMMGVDTPTRASRDLAVQGWLASPSSRARRPAAWAS